MDWIPAAISAAAALIGGQFNIKANKDSQKDAERMRKEELLQQLELEKFRILNAKGGGGGRSRDLELLEMALGIHEDAAKGQSASLQTAANRYAQIYNSAGAGGGR